jgi:hypothetical protein
MCTRPRHLTLYRRETHSVEIENDVAVLCVEEQRP